MPPFLIEWFAKPAAKYLAAAVVALLLLGGFYVKGRNDGYNLVAGELAQQQIEWQAKVNDLQLTHQKDVDDIELQYVIDVTTLESQIEKLRKTPRIITKYVPVQVDKAVPKGLVVLHDRSALGKDLDVDVAEAAEPSEIKLSQFGITVADNYTTCAQDRARLTALQKVVRDFQLKQQELVK